jgi:hypothetical protein
VADVESAGVMRLCLDDVASLVNMGPSAFHQGNESNDDDSSDAVSAFGADDGRRRRRDKSVRHTDVSKKVV